MTCCAPVAIKLGHSPKEAAEVAGVEVACINEAVDRGELIMRRVADGAGVIAHYDLELWLLGQPDYVLTNAQHQAEQDAINEAHQEMMQANRAARLAERAQAKEARAAAKDAREAEDAKLAADLAELERLRRAK